MIRRWYGLLWNWLIGIQLRLDLTRGSKSGLLFYLFSIFPPKYEEKNHTVFKISSTIKKKKSIPHFKIALLDYNCSCIYLQNCKATGSPTLLTTSFFCLKVGLSKNI